MNSTDIERVKPINEAIRASLARDIFIHVIKISRKIYK
jgi:hypothetical protein